MAIYPYGTLRNIPPGVNDPQIICIGAILHVASGTSRSLYPYFNGPSGGIESHFYIRDDGTTEQYRDTKYEADANLHANSFKGTDGKLYGYASIETWGLDDGTWNPAMLTEIKRLLTWLSTTHNFPLHKCATPTDPGVGYHVMFGAPGPWTPVAKTCPGPNRIKQFDNIIVPWMKTATTPAPPTGQEDIIDMATQAEVAQAVSDGIRAYMKDFFKDESGTGDTIWDEARANNKATQDKLDRLVTAVEGLTAVLGKPNA